MEILWVVFVYAIVAAYARCTRPRVVEGVEVSLCLTCANAVVTRGTHGQEWIACNFGGAMRPVKFTVASCSGFSEPQNAQKLVTIAGFVREEPKVYAEVAVK